MTIDIKSEEGRRILFLAGRLDTVSSPQLKEEVENCPEDVLTLIIDMKNVEYVSSAGLRELLNAHKKLLNRKGKMYVRGANDDIKDVFFQTGFSGILNLEQ